jgi:hypothetical protein
VSLEVKSSAMEDLFYTPQAVADLMVQVVSHASPVVIADFAVGDGRLLRAAQRHWPAATFVATDINPQIRGSLGNEGWRVSKCNFLSARSRVQAKALKGSSGNISLVLLNPPFSNRGGTRYEIDAFGVSITCGRAMAFVINAASLLAPRGQIISVLPVGSLSCERDSAAREVLERIGTVEVLAVLDKTTFSRCFPRTAIVRITLGQKVVVTDTAAEHFPLDIFGGAVSHLGLVSVMRGSLQMHRLKKEGGGSGYPVIHSTSLKGNKLHIDGVRTQCSKRRVTGPVVLLPRVGEPHRSKLVVYLSEDELVLSDCVVALRCSSPMHAELLWARLLEDWSRVEASYTGTGSRFITMRKIEELLIGLGFLPDAALLSQVNPHEGVKRTVMDSAFRVPLRDAIEIGIGESSF